MDPSTGVGRTLSSFDSFLNVEIPENITILYPYDIAYTNGGNSIRAISFYDINNNFISGINGNLSTVLNGITIPSDAKTLSATLVKGEFPRNFYLSTIQGNPIIANEAKRDVICYDGKIYIMGSGTWTAETNYRFSLMCKTK